MERLIELVRLEPCLYDTSHPEYTKKVLKDLLWDKISMKTNYKDGRAARDAWLKLRNCHRDAIRRRQRLLNNGCEPISKPWRYEKQLEFLLPYMANRPNSGDTTSEKEELDLNQSENSINYSEIEFVATLQHSDALQIEDCSHIPPVFPINCEVDMCKDSINLNTFDLGSITSQPFGYDENRDNERPLKRPNDHDSEDELKQFFNTMYTSTKKMPALSQHKIKRQIFNLVSDEEEYLLKINNQ